MKQAKRWILGITTGIAFLTSCNAVIAPADYTLNLTGTGGVGICIVEQERENETMCEAEGVYIPGQPSTPRTGIMIPHTVKGTKTSWRNIYFTVELVTASPVQATLLRNGRVCWAGPRMLRRSDSTHHT